MATVRVGRFLSLLLIPLVLLAGSQASFAQDDKEEIIKQEVGADQDEEVDLIDEFAFLEDAGMVELASRHRQEIGMSPSAITVLTREDIEASGATNLPDLLRIVPGMDVILISPSHVSLTSRLHWSNTNNYFQLLIDGRDRCYRSRPGHHPLSPPEAPHPNSHHCEPGAAKTAEDTSSATDALIP
jgi:hypothetical protein